MILRKNKQIIKNYLANILKSKAAKLICEIKGEIKFSSTNNPYLKQKNMPNQLNLIIFL